MVPLAGARAVTHRKYCAGRPGGVPQTPRLRRSRTHLHQSRRRPDALHPEHFRHIAALLLLGQTPKAMHIRRDVGRLTLYAPPSRAVLSRSA